MATKSEVMDKVMQDALASVERLETEARTKGKDESDSLPPTDSPQVEGVADSVEPSVEEDNAAALKDQLLRLAADFDNFRKRTRREYADQRRYGAEPFAREMVGVLDNLERALEHVETETPFVEGVKMVVKQFVDVMGNHGVKKFDSKNAVFDPARHEAVGQLPCADESIRPGSILEELERGYNIYDRLLRPAKVIVARTPDEPAAEELSSTSPDIEDDSVEIEV